MNEEEEKNRRRWRQDLKIFLQNDHILEHKTNFEWVGLLASSISVQPTRLCHAKYFILKCNIIVANLPMRSNVACIWLISSAYLSYSNKPRKIFPHFQFIRASCEQTHHHHHRNHQKTHRPILKIDVYCSLKWK